MNRQTIFKLKFLKLLAAASLTVLAASCSSPQKLINSDQKSVALDKAIFALENKDREKAKRIFRQACDREQIEACHYLGILNEHDQYFVKARILYERACDEGYWKSCTRLGALEVEQNNNLRGVQVLKKSCSHREARGCFLLGSLAQKNDNLELARKFYNKACDSGLPQICGFLDIGHN